MSVIRRSTCAPRGPEFEGPLAAWLGPAGDVYVVNLIEHQAHELDPGNQPRTRGSEGGALAAELKQLARRAPGARRLNVIVLVLSLLGTPARRPPCLSCRRARVNPSRRGSCVNENLPLAPGLILDLLLLRDPHRRNHRRGLVISLAAARQGRRPTPSRAPAVSSSGPGPVPGSPTHEDRGGSPRTRPAARSGAALLGPLRTRPRSTACRRSSCSRSKATWRGGDPSRPQARHVRLVGGGSAGAIAALAPPSARRPAGRPDRRPDHPESRAVIAGRLAEAGPGKVILATITRCGSPRSGWKNSMTLRRLLYRLRTRSFAVNPAVRDEVIQLAGLDPARVGGLPHRAPPLPPLQRSPARTLAGGPGGTTGRCRGPPPLNR